MPSAPYDGKSDEELIALVAEHPHYIAGIIKRYEGKLRRYVRRISACSDDELDDILQEIFIKVYRKSTAFNQKLSFSSWIYRIAHNTAVSRWRKRSRRPQTIGGEEAELLWESIASDDDLSQEMDQRMQADVVYATLEKMSQRYRETLILRYLEEKTYDEISDILQIPPGTVATRINRAKKEFKKFFLS